MKKYIIFSMLLIVSSFSLVQAETFGYGRTETIPINYSLIPTVNNSQYFDGYSVSTLYTYYKSLLDTAYDLVYAPITEPLSLHLNGDNSPTADIDWDNNKISNLADPTLDQDAATKKYVDDNVIPAVTDYWKTTTAQTGLTGDKTGSFDLTTTGDIEAEEVTFNGEVTLQAGDTFSINQNNRDKPFEGTVLTRGLNMGVYHQPTSNKSRESQAIGGLNIVGGDKFVSGATVTALEFGSLALVGIYAGLGDGGSPFLDWYGMNTYAVNGLGSVATAKDVIGHNSRSAEGTTRVYGDIYNTIMRAATTTLTVDGDETILTLEKPTKGDNNKQIQLEGTGDGTGTWYDTERIYSDGNSLVVNDFNVSGNFTGNQIYGGMWYHNHTATTRSFASADTWYPLYFTDATDLNGFTSEGIAVGGVSNLTAQVAGVYRVDYMGIGSGQNNHIYLTNIMVNGIEKPKCGNHHKMAAGGDVITQSGNCIITLAVGDDVGISTQDMGGTSNGEYYGGNLNVVRIGD